MGIIRNFVVEHKFLRIVRMVGNYFDEKNFFFFIGECRQRVVFSVGEMGKIEVFLFYFKCGWGEKGRKIENILDSREDI